MAQRSLALLILLGRTASAYLSESSSSPASQAVAEQGVDSENSQWLSSILDAASQQSPELQSESSEQPATAVQNVPQESSAPPEPPAWANPVVLGAVKEAIPQEMGVTAGFGMQIFEGMVQTFLHKSNFTQEELACMHSSLKDVADLAFNSSKDIANMFTSMLAPIAAEAVAADIQTDQAEMATAKAGLRSAEQMAESGLDLMIAVPRLSQKIGQTVDHLDKFMQDCHAGDSEKSFKIASQHLRDLKYVAGHLQANSADVFEELKSASEAFNKVDYKGFGQQLGRVCRKVLLAGDGDRLLPEGPPSAQEIAEVMTGLLEGFIGPGAELDLSSKQRIPDATDALFGEGGIDGHRLKLQIDLRKCVEKDQKYFESVMTNMYTIFAQFELGLPTSPTSMVSTPALAISELKALPRALRRCGLGKDPEQMFLDVLQAASTSQLRAKLTVDEEVQPTADFDDLAKDWQNQAWFQLGEDMGDMMRKAVFAHAPQLYSVDDTGRLLRHPASDSQLFAIFGLAPAAFLLSALAFVLGRRARTAQGGYEVAQASASEDSDMALVA